MLKVSYEYTLFIFLEKQFYSEIASFVYISHLIRVE